MSDDLTEGQTHQIPDGFVDLNWTRGFGRQVGPLYEKREGARPLAFRVEAHHLNGLGACHGGMLMTFADIAWGRLISLERSQRWVTVRLLCDFLAGAREGDWVEGAGELVGEADGVFTVRGKVWCGETLLMSGSGLFKALGPREPRPGEKAWKAK